MQLPDEAIEAAAKAIAYHEPRLAPVDAIDLAALLLEAAAPFMFKNMRSLSLVEIEERDNPERMKAARQRVRAEAKTDGAANIRAAKAEAWDEGSQRGWNDGYAKGMFDMEQKARNPYREARDV